jgi:GMP synthase-like glutamine amidotransferase
VSTARLLVLQFDDGYPAARLGDWLTEAGLELETRRVDLGETPESLAGFDGLLVMGAPISAYDVVDYLAPAKALLREAVSKQVPTLGVCFGAQLLAAANGGRVEPNPEGPELGAYLVAKRSTAATDPLFRELPIMPDVVQWHWDAITSLPPGAIQLASSVTCENQAFRLGRVAWGVQFHIETTPQIVAAWAAQDADKTSDYDVERILQRTDAVHDDVEETWRPFANAFAAIVGDPASVAEAPHALPTSFAEPITDPAAIRAALAAELEASRAPMGAKLIQLQTRNPND